MNVIICGAGEVGRHTAEVLARQGENITIVDLSGAKLAELEDTLDVRNLEGNATHAEVLAEAGCARCDLFIAATNIDEVNLLAATVAKGVGAAMTIARVHHSAYFERRGLAYDKYLGIDHLVCPEYVTAQAIASTLRSPGALAIERFARGRIELQQITVAASAQAVGKPLAQLKMPAATRIASIEREGTAFLPDSATQLQPGDIITLIGDTAAVTEALRLMQSDRQGRRRVIIYGGSTLAVWLCRAMRSRLFSIRLLVPERARAEELAEKLGWVTVIRADATDPTVMEQERADQTDVFVAVSDDDEQNILLAARAKSLGARYVISVVQRPTYLHLIEHVGIDRAFSPRVTAANEVLRLIEQGPLRHLASLAAGIADVYEVRVPAKAANVVSRPLREVKFPPKTMIAAIQRGEDVHVPSADDMINPGDIVVVIGPSNIDRQLRKTFNL